MNLRSAIFPSRGVALVWVLFLIGLLAWLAVRMSDEPILDANLMSLLPSVESDTAVQVQPISFANASSAALSC